MTITGPTDPIVPVFFEIAFWLHHHRSIDNRNFLCLDLVLLVAFCIYLDILFLLCDVARSFGGSEEG